MKDLMIDKLLYILVGAVITWFFFCNDCKYINNTVTKAGFHYITDTVKTIDSIYLPVISVKPELIKVHDTVYINNYPSASGDLIAYFDFITDSLVKTSSARYKYFEKITENKDTVNITLEAFRDEIIAMEIRLSAQEVIKNNLRTIYLPKPEKEEWWIKPAIAVGSLTVGYILGGGLNANRNK